MHDIYLTDHYAELNPTWHEEDSPWKARQIEAIIRKNRLNFDSLCEVGCGTGEILLNLSQAFPKARLAGYEISPHAYQRAKTKETSRVSFHMGDILEERDYLELQVHQHAGHALWRSDVRSSFAVPTA